MTTRGQVLSMLLLTAGISGVLRADVAPGCGGSKHVRPTATPPPTVVPATPEPPTTPAVPMDEPKAAPPIPVT